MDRSQLTYLLKKYNIKPRRENGQNFLVNDKIVTSLIESAELNENDTVLEIGPGLGAVTVELCKTAKKVIAVEQDRDFIPILNQLKVVNNNLEIINQDVFKVDLEVMPHDEGANTYSRLQSGNFKIISNLPFNITSLVFRYFLENGPRPQQMSVLIQKEVAQRIVAEPGQHSLLSLSVQLFGEPEIVEMVSSDNFFPPPKVDCAIVKVKNIKKPDNISSVKDFFSLLRIGFSAKRKKLSNNIANGLKKDRTETEKIFKILGFSSNLRAQELSINNWVQIFDHFRKNVI